jgi:Lon-like ATP-dependent protease
LSRIIAQYCREAGVRTLQKQLEKIHRKVAMKIAKGEGSQIITADNLEQFIGKPKYKADRLYDTPPIGVITGLAYNQLGGSLIWIESVVIHHKKPGLKTTGKLGKVMKESIEIAFTFAKKFTNEIDPANTFFDTVSLSMEIGATDCHDSVDRTSNTI